MVLYKTDIKEFDKVALTTALKNLEGYDPTIKKEDYKNKNTLMAALLYRGFNFNLLPSKTSYKKAVKRTIRAAKQAAKNNLQIPAAPPMIEAQPERMNNIILPNEAIAMPNQRQKTTKQILAQQKKEEKRILREQKAQEKEANKMAKEAAKNALKIRNEANKAAGLPLEKPARAIRQAKPQKELTERQMAIAEFRRGLPEPLAVGPLFKGPLMPNQIRLKKKVDLEKKAAKKAITEANKVAKKAAKEAEKAIKKATKAEQKQQKLIDREAFKRTLPEPLAVGPRFKGPLMPNQIRLKRSRGSYKLNNLLV